MSPAHNLERQRTVVRSYHQRWKALIAEGQQPAVITRSENPDLWAAWRSYFKANSLGLQTSLMDDKGYMTVPTPHPADFDDAVAVRPDRRVKDD
jgi:hypothetical protein